MYTLRVVWIFITAAAILLFFAWVFAPSSNPLVNTVGHVLAGLVIVTLVVGMRRQLRFFRDYYVPEETPFLIVDTEAHLEILDERGALAHYHKSQVCEVIRNGVNGYRMSNLSTDGSLKNLKVGGTAGSVSEVHDPMAGQVDAGTQSGIVGVETLGSPGNLRKLDVRVKFDRAYTVGQRIRRTLDLDFCDSFTNQMEYFKVEFVNPIKRYSIKISWPVGYAVARIWIDRRFTLEESITVSKTFLAIHQQDSRLFVTFTFEKPKVGSSATFRWERG